MLKVYPKCSIDPKPHPQPQTTVKITCMLLHGSDVYSAGLILKDKWDNLSL